MKKSALSLAALVLVSASSLSASAQSPTMGANAIGGCNPRPQAIGGCNPRPQGVIGGVYALVMQFFCF